MSKRGIVIKRLTLWGFGLWVVGIALLVQAAPPPPTVSILNPKPGTLASPSVISPQRITNNFKVQVQVWNDVADITGVAVGYYQGATPDTGTWTWVNAALNSNYNCGSNCGIYDAVLSLAAGDYYLMARAVSTGDGTGYSRDNRTGNDARYIYIRVAAAGAGTGNLLARDYASQLCLDCHNLKSHSSQTASNRYSNWQVVCFDCHTPHNTTNIYLVKETITTPNSGQKTVRFYNAAGDAANSNVNSGAGGSTTGVCQVCHTQTQGMGGVARWRNTGNSDPNHYQIPNTQRCTTTCHLHEKGFSHTGGANCSQCHGHEDDWPGGPWYGTKKSHATHTENDSNNLRGPNITCADCHNTSNYPAFKDGATTLAATTVCNTCHSPGGTYDGVNDAVIGAKANWNTGIYNLDGTLIAGKEKWCAGCHDNGTSVIQTVNAPNVIGDENAVTDYGIGYGYYKSGHGLPNTEVYGWTKKPGDPTQRMGAGLGCMACHDTTLRHTDGLARTYESLPTCPDPMDCWTYSGTPEGYRQGYRLKLVNGNVPLVVPRMGTSLNSNDFRLCFGCHDSNPIMGGSFRTNFRTEGNRYDNSHGNHLGFQDWFASAWPSDWNYSYQTYTYGSLLNPRFDSRVTCVTCHNVHGSTRLAMANDGKLVNREPGFQVWYNKADMSHSLDPSPCPPVIVSVNNLADSTGTLVNMSNLNNTTGFCIGCHSGCSPNGNQVQYRWPYEKLPVTYQAKGAAGSNTVTVKFSQGVYSEANATGNLVPTDFTFSYFDPYGSCGGRTITAVNHTAGEDTATVTLSAPLCSPPASFNLAPATPLSIYDGSGQALSMATPKPCIDTGPPGTGMSGVSPPNGTYFVDPNADITFHLVDYCAGVDWNTFSIQIVGSYYSQSYGPNSPEVTKTGTPDDYSVTVNPPYFGDDFITVTVNVKDFYGNTMSPLVWWFCTMSCGM